jgi:hypothetical protein
MDRSMTITDDIIATGSRSAMKCLALDHNADTERRARDGTAILRFSPGIGWHVTVTPWVGAQ